MSVNDLIIAGDLDEPESVTLWLRGKGAEATIRRKKPFALLGAEAFTCRIDRQELADIVVTLTDPVQIGEFRIRLRGAVRIAREEDLLRARSLRGGIDVAIAFAVRRALNTWHGGGAFVTRLFPSGRDDADSGAADAVLAALRKIGLEIETAQLRPFGWRAEERVELKAGPRRVQCSDAGAALNLSADLALVPDHMQLAAYLTSKEATAGDASLKTAAETHFFEWLEGRFSRHEHTYEAARIETELRADLDSFCGRKFGYKIARLYLDNGVRKVTGAEAEAFDFVANYKIAANTADIEVTHRCQVVIIDVGRAPNGLEQRRKEAEERIHTAIQSRLLGFSQHKVLAELHTFRGENDNALSRWAASDPTLREELRNRGLQLRYLYAFTNVAKEVPSSQDRAYRHVQSYPIRGTNRVLTLKHEIIWAVGDTAAQQSRYVECGAPAPETFEEEFLAKELDAQAAKRLLPKPFGEVVFDFFRDQATTEAELSEDLQGNLQTYAAQFGVEVDAVSTVFEQLPEARLLMGKSIPVPMKVYSLADTEYTIQLAAKTTVRMLKDSDGGLLKQHLSGGESDQIFDQIASGIAEQIEFHMAGVKPWQVFSMGDTDETPGATAIETELKGRVNNWLAKNFGLEIDPGEGFHLQIGSCSLLDARGELIGHDDKIEVTALVHSKRLDSEVAAAARIEVTLLIPYIIKGVHADDNAQRCFMEMFRSSGSSDAINEKIKSTIQRTTAGLMQPLDFGAFIPRNFSQNGIDVRFAAANFWHVIRTTGLVVEIQPSQIIPIVNQSLAVPEALIHQDVYQHLLEKIAEEEKRPEPDENVLANYRKRLAVKKSEIETTVREQGVGGKLDLEALADVDRQITHWFDQHEIPIPKLVSKDAAAGQNVPEEPGHQDDAVDAQFTEITPAAPDIAGEAEGASDGEAG